MLIKHAARSRTVSIALVAALLSACTSVTGTTDGVRPVQITFEARVGSQPLHCGQTYANVGTSNASLTLQDFRIYVSEVALVGPNGQLVPITLTADQQWQNDSVTLLDFENATGNCNGNSPTNLAVRGTTPAGDYNGLQFTIGVPLQYNHKDPTLAAAPLNYSGLTWPWRFGYKFTTIDLETGGKPAMPANKMSAMQPSSMRAMHQAAASGFSIHIGSTECGAGSPTTPPATPCLNGNRAVFRLPAFNAERQKVVLDLGALLANTDVTVNAPGSASGCMSGVDDDDCIAIMDRLGLTYRGKSSTGQAFVRVE